MQESLGRGLGIKGGAEMRFPASTSPFLPMIPVHNPGEWLHGSFQPGSGRVFQVEGNPLSEEFLECLNKPVILKVPRRKENRDS